jgi:D-aminoacyl-tRNA deacylase
MIEQMIKKSVEEVKYALMDWKGLGKEKDRLNNIVIDMGLKVVKV